MSHRYPSPHRQPWRARLAEPFATRLRTRADRLLVWRLLAPLVFVAAGVLFITSAVSSGGTDLRAGRYQDLAGLLEAQTSQVQSTRARAAVLNAQVNRLSENLGTGPVKKAQAEVDALRGAAGMAPARGPGLTISLNDAPSDIQASAANVADTIVHQQDIQAVANAMWAGGATAMTIQDQRVVSTTGIKCVGNTVRLHDVPYAPPYVLTAVGPIARMTKAINDSAYIRLYLEAVDRYALGWSVTRNYDIQLPAYTGSTELRYATAVRETGSNLGNAE